MKRFKKNIFFFVLLLASFVIIFFVGFSFGRNENFFGQKSINVINKEKGQNTDVDFSLYWEAWNKFSQKSVVSPDPQKMIYSSIEGLLSSVNDPYTVFFSPEDNQRFKEDIQGEFDGIGVEIVSKNNLPTVVAPLSKTPAEAAGLKPGDIIVEVDGAKTSDLSFNETIDRIRGKRGTKVSLKIVREGATEVLSFDITRETISVKSVEWENKEFDGKKYYHVKIRQFGDDTATLFEQFSNDVIREKVDGIVVDLRNNPGGYLETSIDLSSYFLDGGVVVIEKDRNGKNKEYKVTKKARLKNFKTVVLVNEGSASASEIFAGALQDRKIGKVIGEKTFGKGSVQELIELSDKSAIKVTVAKWLTPNGRTINGDGIEPDIKIVNDNENEDNQFNRAIEYLKTGK